MRNTLSLSLVLFVLAAAAGVSAIEPASEGKQPQSSVETIPFSQMKQWLHFTRADLDAISVKNGQLDFSSRFIYEGDHSLRWKYQPGSTLIWKCDAKKLGKNASFYLPLLEPQIDGNPPSSFQLQFLDATGKVVCHSDVPLVRPFWNRVILRYDDGSGDHVKMEIGIKDLEGQIPDSVSEVRLVAPADHSGELFLSSWFLTPDRMVRCTDAGEVNGFPAPCLPDPATLPTPTAAELATSTR